MTFGRRAPRVFGISDIHVCFEHNRSWIKDISATEFLQDAVIVAGDVSDRMELIAEALREFKARFAEVFFVEGNHDVWVKGSPFTTSAQKLNALEELCKQLGVHTTAQVFADAVWIVPLHSWYNGSCSPGFSDTLDADTELISRNWGDFYRCAWGSEGCAKRGGGEKGEKSGKVFMDEAKVVAQQMLSRNLVSLRAVEAGAGVGDGNEGKPSRPVITFSHFLPRLDLLPHRSSLKIPQLELVSVCPDLDDQIRSINSSIHIFGHTHIQADTTIDGVRYIQRPLGYPKEPWTRVRESKDLEKCIVYTCES